MMPTTDLDQPITVRTILCGSDEDAVEALQATITSGSAATPLAGALATLPKATRAAAVEQFSRVVAGLLAVDLTEALMSGWRKYPAFTAAARRTAHEADTEELLDLVTHEISWAQEPSVELFVDELKVATVHFRLALNIEVKAMVAAIGAGRLTAVHSGKCTLEAVLEAGEITLLERQAHVNLPLVLSLGGGLVLCDPFAIEPA